jgi:hypothetical protein
MRGTLMRHFLAPEAVTALTIGVLETATTRPLIAFCSRTQ